MVGYPKFINTKDDLEYVKRSFPGDNRTRSFLQSLLEERFAWYPVAELAAEDAGRTDETNKVVEIEMAPGESARWQYERRENPTARIFRMGLTVEEVVNLCCGFDLKNATI